MTFQQPAAKPAQDAADQLAADRLAVEKYAVGQSVPRKEDPMLLGASDIILTMSACPARPMQ